MSAGVCKLQEVNEFRMIQPLHCSLSKDHEYPSPDHYLESYIYQYWLICCQGIGRFKSRRGVKTKIFVPQDRAVAPEVFHQQHVVKDTITLPQV